jgi:hypothetical protein
MLALILLLPVALAAPKYGPNAVPLSKRSNTEYFKRSEAPDFWTLIPYYLPQPTGRACSAATLTTLLNGARASKALTSEDKLLTVEAFAREYADKPYAETVLGKGMFNRKNVTSRNLTRLIEQATGKLGIKTDKTKVTLNEVDYEHPEKSKKLFLEQLKQNEKSSDDFIVLSAFIQGTLTGDPEGPPHVGLVAAYDDKTKQVLILDPDREWYEPYWSPVDQVWEAVRDPKADGNHSAWIHFQVR